MPIRRPILLAAAATAAFGASPALAQGGYDVPVGDAWAGSAGSWDSDYSYGATTGGPVYYGEGDAGADYAGGYTGEPAYYDEPVYDEPVYVGPGPAPVQGGAYSYENSYSYGPAPIPAHGGLPPQPGAQRLGYSDAQRADWLRECRRRYGRDNDDGLGGAVIGGLIGGVAGNRIAGKGNRVVGTVIGAGVGALAGSEIDKAEDRGRAADQCEAYLEQYEAYYAQGGGAQAYGAYPAHGGGYAYGYGQNVMWVPVVVGWNCKPKKEEVVEEWVEEAPARRVIYTKPAPTKVIKTKTIKYSK